MARYTKTGTPNTVGEINSQFDLIATAIDDTLSRKGDTPNQMETSLDMNNNRILNLPPPASPLEPMRLKDLTVGFNVDGILAVTEETLAITANNLLYTFPSVKQLAGSAFFVRDSNSDVGVRLIKGFDYELREDISLFTLELKRSWNTGAVLLRVYNSFAGATSFSTSSNKPVLANTTELVAAITFATGYEVVVPSLSARYVLRDATYTALSGDVTRIDSKVWELQPDSDGDFSVINFGAAPDSTDTIEQSSYFAAAALRVGNTGFVSVPEGRFKVSTPTATSTQWKLAPNSEIIGLGGVTPTFVTDTTNLSGSMLRYQRNAKDTVLFAGETDYATQKNRDGEVTGTRGTVGVITACSHLGNGGLFGGSVSNKSNTLNQACIGVTGVVVNNNTTVDRTAWAGYLEAIQDVGAGGNTFTLEGAIVNKNTGVQTTPNTQPSYGAGVTAGLWISSGIGDSDDENASCWGAVVPITQGGNTTGFLKGWVVYDGGVASGANYAEVNSWLNNGATVWYPAKTSPSNTVPIGWTKCFDDGTGQGIMRFKVQNTALTASAEWSLTTSAYTPTTNNTEDLGAASTRIKTIYLQNSPDVVSDENEKQEIRGLTDNELAAGLEIARNTKFFKWNDEVLEKGIDDAYFHCSVIAQKVWDILENNSLSPEDYGFVSNNEDGWSIIQSELSLFTSAALVAEQDSLKARIAILEGA
jgi:hypothetical protein